jgi:mono/diheme cytochrome c family protein
MRTIYLLSLLLAFSPAASEPSPGTARLYQSNCSVCHGENGDGASHARQGLNPPPKDFTSRNYAQMASRETIASFIRHGKSGTAMVAWESVLSPQEIDDLADYIMTSFVAPLESDVKSNDEALALYQQNCSVCHGDDGAGAVWGQESLASPPRNFRSEASRRELDRGRMIAAVSFGKPGTPMPGFATQLEPEQIEAVVDYVRTTFMSAEPSQNGGHTDASRISTAEHQSVPMPLGLAGDPARGNALYLMNCTACHGVAGDGNGPRAYFIYPRPRNFLDLATREILNRPQLFDGIRQGVIGKEMPAWGKVLDDQAIADITEYVYRNFIRSVDDTPD